MIKNFVFPSVGAGLSIPGGSIGAAGTHIRCTQGNAPFEVRAYSGSELVFYASSWQAGLSCGPIFDLVGGTRAIKYFDRVEVVNGSVAQTIELYIGDGEVLDNRLVGTVNITGGILSRSIGADTLDNNGIATLVAAGAGADTIIKAATTSGVEILIQNLGSVPVVIAQSLTTIGGWTTTATTTGTGGLILEPVPAGANVGGSVTLSGGIVTRGVGIGGTARVTWTATKFV